MTIFLTFTEEAIFKQNYKLGLKIKICKDVEISVCFNLYTLVMYAS